MFDLFSEEVSLLFLVPFHVQQNNVFDELIEIVTVQTIIPAPNNLVSIQ
jgi:hypothetical protein